MALRKAIGAVKDQTTIGIVKVTSTTVPGLKIAIVKATSHDDDPASERHIREILTVTSYSRLHVNSCISTISKRLSKTRDWIVALKVLVLVNRLLVEGDPEFVNEIVYATRRGTRLLNLSDFRDEAHSSSWDHTTFVRTYGFYLDHKAEFMVYEHKQSGSTEARPKSPPARTYRSASDDYSSYGVRVPQRSHSYDDVGELRYKEREERKPRTPLREMKVERILARMGHLQRLLDRFLACRPMGIAKNSRMVMVALYPLVQESFKLYGDICEVLSVLLDRFFDMEYVDCVKVFEVYASVGKQIDELIGFYNWCKDAGLARSSDYPQVQRVTGKVLETLEEFIRDREKIELNPKKIEEPQEEVVVEDIKALPAPEVYHPPPPPPEFEPEVEKPKQETGDLVDLREEIVSNEDQSNRLALALFSAPQATPVGALNGVTSAWQNPAAESGKADWELALVESVSHLSVQNPTLPGGMDPLMLNGMYDQGMVRQHMSTAQLGGGSASSVALPGLGKSTTPVLALPAPDGSVQTVGQDPFAASTSIPPPSYVQMADMEKKQQLLVQEQQLWNQYAREGMQGQVSLAKIGGSGFYNPGPTGMVVPYGTQPGGYYYTNY